MVRAGIVLRPKVSAYELRIELVQGICQQFSVERHGVQPPGNDRSGGLYLYGMDQGSRLNDPQKANEVGVLSFMLNRVIMQQRMLADVIAKVEGTTQAEVLARMDVMLKQTEGETIKHLKRYWMGEGGEEPPVEGNGSI